MSANQLTKCNIKVLPWRTELFIKTFVKRESMDKYIYFSAQKAEEWD